MMSDVNDRRNPTDIADPPMPRWATILRRVNVVALLLWIGLLLVALVWASASSAGDDSAFSLSLLLVAPALIAARFAPVVGLLIVLLIVGTVLLVRFRRRGMDVGHAVSAYTLLAWTAFWVVMWMCTLGVALIG